MLRQIILPQELRNQIEREARAAMPGECCGLIEGSRRFDAVVADAVHPAKNLANRRDRFEIDPADHFRLLHAARGAKHEIFGCYHSHPNGAPHPSGFDAENAESEDFIWLVAAVTREDFGLGAFVFANGSFRRVSMLQVLKN